MSRITRDMLYDALVTKNMTYQECATYFNSHASTIQSMNKRYGTRIGKAKKDNHKIIDIDKDRLIDLYVNQNFNSNRCGEVFNCTGKTILSRLKEFGIKIKQSGMPIGTSSAKKLHLDKKYLYELYVNQKLSSNQISKIFNCSIPTVLAYLKEYNIQLRDLQENKKLFPPVAERIIVDKDLLYDLYVKQRKTTEFCAKFFGCSSNVITRRLKSINVQPRNLSESHLGYKMPLHRKIYQRERFTGSKNPSWKGGVSFEPYPYGWNDNLKNSIRCRDGCICQVCAKSKHNNNNKQLDVHHIDHDKYNLSVTNLISLCAKCHRKVHKKEYVDISKYFLQNVVYANLQGNL